MPKFDVVILEYWSAAETYTVEACDEEEARTIAQQQHDQDFEDNYQDWKDRAEYAYTDVDVYEDVWKNKEA